MEYPGKTRGCKSCGADTKDLDYYPGMAVLGKVYCPACRAPEPEPETRIVTDIGGGYWAESFARPCANAPKCTNKVWHSFASHGGDMFDPEYPPMCKPCEAEAMARMRVAAGMDYEAALDPDDLPFD